jgi:hypothetical protein
MELYDGKIVWGCAFKVTNNKKNVILFKKPVLGVVHIEPENIFGGLYGKFYELKKGGGKKSTCVDMHSRIYAETYTESVENYNYEIEFVIDSLENTIFALELSKIGLVEEL